MSKNKKKNKSYLEEMGINHLGLQDIAIKKIPCGVSLVQNAMEDGTAFQINGPRALMMCHYKGFISGIIEAQNVLDKIDDESVR